MGLLLFLAQAVVIALPVVIANMMPVLVKNHFNFLKIPVDFGVKLKGEPLFGKNKTIRGFVFGIAGAILVCWLESLLASRVDFFREITLIDYSRLNPALVGFLLGFGALFGDLVESFIKRRLKIAPGEKFFPWDQIDLLIGALLFLAIVYIPPWTIIVFFIVATPLLHRIINIIAYHLKIKDKPW